jgi:hypothetical protein
MGAVYLAEHLSMGRQVALKVMRANLVDNPAALARFRHEVRAAARLSHPNIVTAYDADEADGLHFLVMEFVEGTLLDEHVARHGRLPVAEACQVAEQVALGLQHAHEKGLIHRDIKPQNLMRTPAGQVKILDFGLARLTRDPDSSAGASITASGIVMGSADFIAPEQTRGERAVDIRADVYSLGCTLYYLLCGQVPFPKGTVIDKMMHHNLDRPQALRDLCPELPRSLVAVIETMMDKEPGRRYQTPGEAAQALHPFAHVPDATAVQEVFPVAELEAPAPRRPAPAHPVRVPEPAVRRKRAPSVVRPPPDESNTGILLGLISLGLALLSLTGVGLLLASFVVGWLSVPVCVIGLMLSLTGIFIPGPRRRLGRSLSGSGATLNLLVLGAVLIIGSRDGRDNGPGEAPHPAEHAPPPDERLQFNLEALRRAVRTGERLTSEAVRLMPEARLVENDPAYAALLRQLDAHQPKFHWLGVKMPGVPWERHWCQSRETISVSHRRRLSEGYRLAFLTSFLDPFGGPSFGGCWVKDGKKAETLFDVPHGQFEEKRRQLPPEWRLSWLHARGEGPEQRWTAVWLQEGPGVDSEYTEGLELGQLPAQIADRRKERLRPALIVPYRDQKATRFAVVWRKDDQVAEALLGLSAEDYRARLQTPGAGRQPQFIASWLEGDRRLYLVLLVRGSSTVLWMPRVFFPKTSFESVSDQFHAAGSVPVVGFAEP